jgi:hypothetical protein
VPGYSLTAPVCLSVSVTFSLCKHKCTEKRECVHMLSLRVYTGKVSPKSLASLVALPGVVGLVALEGLSRA